MFYRSFRFSLPTSLIQVRTLVSFPFWNVNHCLGKTLVLCEHGLRKWGQVTVGLKNSRPSPGLCSMEIQCENVLHLIHDTFFPLFFLQSVQGKHSSIVKTEEPSWNLKFLLVGSYLCELIMDVCNYFFFVNVDSWPYQV